METAKNKVTLYEGKYLRLCLEDRWEWVERVNCTGVVVIVGKTPENRAILVEQYRIPAKTSVIEFPAGLVGDNGRCEALQTAAERELLEETGYSAAEWALVAEGPPSAGMSPETISIFLAKGLKKIGPGGGDHTESIIVHEVEMGEIDAWLKRQTDAGKQIDPKIYAGLYFLR